MEMSFRAPIVSVRPESMPTLMLRQPTGLSRIGHFGTDLTRLQFGFANLFRCLMAQGLLANNAPPTGQFLPMNPVAVHPIVHRRSADSRDRKRVVNWEELRFLVTMLTEKGSHDHTAIHAA